MLYEQWYLIESYINLRGISWVLANKMPRIIVCIIENNCLIIKSVALRKKVSPLYLPHFSLMSAGIETQRYLFLYLQYMLTEAAPFTVMDALSLTRQEGVGGGSVLSLSGPSSINERHRTVGPCPAAHPPPHSFPPTTCLLAATWLIVPVALHRHYYQIIMIHSVSGCRRVRFSVEDRSRAGRAPRWTDRQREGGKSAIRLHFQGGKKSHHWLNHLYNIGWFQQFHLMRKSTLSL